VSLETIKGTKNKQSESIPPDNTGLRAIHAKGVKERDIPVFRVATMSPQSSWAWDHFDSLTVSAPAISPSYDKMSKTPDAADQHLL